MQNEFQILQQLRETPELLAFIRESSSDELSIQTKLRSKFDADVVRAALSLHKTRKKASPKFSQAEKMWFDRQGYEQATAEIVAQHKAKRFSGTVWDLCCGIGSDAIAMTKQAEVIAVDRNPVACLRTSWNAGVYSVANSVQPVCADVTKLKFNRTELVHIDPDRRSASHGRAVRIEDYEPGVEFLQQTMSRTSGGAIKLSPASNFAGQFENVEYELVSLKGECKEATIWFGSLAEPGVWRATVLPEGDSLAGDPLDAYAERTPLGNYLYDPDPSIVRSGLVDLLCDREGFSRLDDTEEYLTSENYINSHFARGFEVLDELPNNARDIRRYFRNGDFRSVEIKCRHIPINAEAVRKKLPLKGTQPVVLFYARIDGKARAIVARRVNDHAS